MARRVNLPPADDLFRPTEESSSTGAATGTTPSKDGPDETRKPSGRVKHDEKMTVYITSDELLDLEHARLSLRRGQRLAVDRGRIVREAVSMVLADFEAHGDDSALVRRLRDE